jgi:hypothetical protein
MDRPAIADALTRITGTWVAGRGTAGADLAAARSALAGLLLTESRPDDVRTALAGRAGIAPVEAGARAAIERIVEQLPEAPSQDLRVFIRHGSVLDPAALAGIAGMKASRTLGPFIDELGTAHLVDLIPIPRKIPIEGIAGALALLVLDRLPLPQLPEHSLALPHPPAQRIAIGAGSLWVAVHAVLGGTTTGYVGLAFTKGEVELVNVHAAPGGGLLLQAGSRLTLSLTLGHPAPPPVVSPTGRDAAQMTVDLPATVTIAFQSTGAVFTAVGASSGTVYGTGFTLTRDAAGPHLRSFDLSYLVLPCSASIATFAIASCLSSDFIVSGDAPVTAGGWVLPVTTAAPAGLGEASGAGLLLLQMGAGIKSRFANFAAPVAVADLALIAEPAKLIVVAHTGPRLLRDRLLLWGPAPADMALAVPEPIRRVSEIDIACAPGALVYAVITPGSETVIIACSGAANLDRPLAVDGSRLPLAYTAGFAGFVDDAGGKRVVLVLQTPPQTERGRVLALENALLAARPSSALLFSGQRAGNRYAGILELAFPLGGIVPTLPDPYAASFPTPQLIDTGTSGTLLARMNWTPSTIPPLEFSITGTPLALHGNFTLLDVSTNADQFGVSVVGREELGLAIDAQALVARDAVIAVYALPGISWEPVVNDQLPAPVHWLDAFSADDGPATNLRSYTVDLVRIEPLVALPHFQKTARSAPTTADFTLPFGLMAHMTADPQQPGSLPTFDLIKANYASGVTAGLQLAIKAAAKSKVGSLPGYTTTGSTIHPPLNAGSYGDQVLGNADQLDAAQFFNEQFADGQPTAEIPVDRIDLSGYGTSMFSDWAIDDPNFVGVVRTRFDVLVGRTAYELVQIQTVIVPFSIRQTRTIIFDRYDTGLVVRHDTGWKAIGDAAFELLKGHVLPGGVQRLTNVHNIRVGTGTEISFPSPDLPEYAGKPPAPPISGGHPARQCIFVPVTFDADVIMNMALVGAMTNGNVSPRVAGSNIAGWAQLNIGYAASPAEILTLMGMLGPAGVSGALGCVVNVGPLDPGAAQFTMNVSSLSAAATKATTTISGHTVPASVAVALNGTPRLPRDGAWSITRRAGGSQTPTAVDAATPIPLVRARAATGDQWRLLDPSDALSVSGPATFYGIVQGAGTSKTLFEHPIIDDLGKALNIDQNHLPNLADVGALLGATDIFPNLGAVLALDQQPNPLNLVQDGFKQTYEQDIDQPDRTIFDLGIIKIVLSYSAPDDHGVTQKTHVKFVLDPTASPRWSLDVTGISFEAVVDGFGPDPLLTIYGNFSGSETQKPGVSGIQVEYGSALSLVKDVFSGLGPLIQSLGGEVDLDVGFSGNKLSVRDFLAVPTIPLGFGDIKDITLDLGFEADIPSGAGFHVGLGSKDKPFTWLVSPLSGTGAVVLGAQNGDIDVYVEAGIGAGLAIDVAIASGSASIDLDLALTIAGATISVTATLLGQAEVSVLGGLASASLTLAASITITPEPLAFPPNDIGLTAAVAVGIHISICWVVSVDFDGSWQFSQDVPVHL